MTEPTAAAPVCYRHPDRETWIRCQRCDNPICPDCMTSAAVGFQCPSCVKQGAKSTRTGRLPYGGERSGNPALTTFVLIAVNVLVWILIKADERPGGFAGDLVQSLWLLPQSPGLASTDSVADGDYWQVITSVFAHIGAMHLALNMVILYFIGPKLETILGRTRFLVLYLVSGLTGSVLVMLVTPANTPTLGASGAIIGVLGALVVIAVKARGDVQQYVPWLAIVTFYSFFGSNDTSWEGHVGGFVGGALTAAVLAYSPKDRRSLFQWSGVVTIILVSVVLIAVRAAALA